MNQLNILPSDPIPDDFSPENVLAILAKELGYALEYGFKDDQYLFKKQSKDKMYPTLYCAVRYENGSLKLTGIKEIKIGIALADPDCLSKLERVLNSEFWLRSTRQFDLPLNQDR